MHNCVFCGIAAGDIPAHVLYEDAALMVILDAFPSSLGHALVIPKNHADDIYTLPAETAGRLFVLAAQTATRLKDALSCDGINILQNNGEAAGQTVHHFHLHIIPRYKGDDVRIAWHHAAPSAETVQAFAAKWKNE